MPIKQTQKDENLTLEHRNYDLGRNEAGKGDGDAETSPAALHMPIAAAPARGVTEDRKIQRNYSGRFPFMSPHAQRIRPVPKHAISQWAKEVVRRGRSLGRTQYEYHGCLWQKSWQLQCKTKNGEHGCRVCRGDPIGLGSSIPYDGETFLEMIDNQHHHHHGNGQIEYPVNLHPVLVSIVGPWSMPMSHSQ